MTSKTWTALERETQQNSLLFATAFTAFAIAIALGWVGFIGSDDSLYAAAAQRWLQHGPTLGTSHWSLRLTAILPIAVSFAVFGVREFSLILPTILYAIATTAMFTFVAKAVLNFREAAFAVLLFVTAPVFVLSASYAGIDQPELLFDITSIFLFVLATNSTRQSTLLFLSGLFAGLGWICRETSIFLAVGYGVLFCIGFRIKRERYLYILAGFAAIAGAEMFFYYLLTGSPFYRLNISFHHDNVNRNISVGMFDGAGNLHTGSFLDPLLMMFFNKDFGVLFWLSIPAAVWFLRSKSLPQKMRDGLYVFLIVGGSWLLTVSLLSVKLYLLTRYLLVPFTAAALLVGAWLGFDIYPRSKRAAVCILLASTFVNLGACFLENNDLMFPPRKLVSYAETANALVYTDPQTRRRAQFLLDAENLGRRVTSSQHHLGDIFFYVPTNSGLKNRGAGYDLLQAARYRPLAGEHVIAHFEQPHRLAARLLDFMHLSPLVPAPIMQKLAGNAGSVLVYRADKK